MENSKPKIVGGMFFEDEPNLIEEMTKHYFNNLELNIKPTIKQQWEESRDEFLANELKELHDITIITGGARTGKSTLAENMTTGYKTAYMRCWKLERTFGFSVLKDDYDIVICECINEERMMSLIRVFLNKMMIIDIKGEECRLVKVPKLIIDCDISVFTKETLNSYTTLNRINHIHLS